MNYKDQLIEFEKEEVRLHNELEAVRKIIAGLRHLTGSMMSTNAAPQPSLGMDSKISMRQAVMDTLKESNAPIHVKDIYAAAQDKGATTTAKNPLSIIDLIIGEWTKKGQVEKVGPRLYKWVQK